MFSKEERSSFSYWFAHWCAFQMTALNHKMWKVKYLFHDIEKPWMKLFFSYPTVQKWHRTRSKHHPEWLDRKLATCQTPVDYFDALYYIFKFDYKAMIIDWECSRFTKEASPKTARQELDDFFNSDKYLKYTYLFGDKEYLELFEEICYMTLETYGF